MFEFLLGYMIGKSHSSPQQSQVDLQPTYRYEPDLEIVGITKEQINTLPVEGSGNYSHVYCVHEVAVKGSKLAGYSLSYTAVLPDVGDVKVMIGAGKRSLEYWNNGKLVAVNCI